jgi:hypothetical protein
VVSVVPSESEAVLTVLSKLNRKVGDGGPLKGVAGPVSRFKAPQGVCRNPPDSLRSNWAMSYRSELALRVAYMVIDHGGRDRGSSAMASGPVYL